MAHDVFISYSSRDKPVADAVCATLESRQVRCWMAPRDILPGVPYAEALSEALRSSRALVLVLSAQSNTSKHVMREVESAVDGGIPVVPLRIADVPLSKPMDYFLKAIHWLDAITPPLEKHLQTLGDTVERLLARPTSAEAPKAVAPPLSAIPTPNPLAPSRTPWVVPTAAVAAAVLLILGGWWLTRPKDVTADPSKADNAKAGDAPIEVVRLDANEQSPAVRALLKTLYEEPPPGTGAPDEPPQFQLGLNAKRKGESAYRALDDGEPLASEVDRYFAVVVPRTSGHLYVFQVDSRGHIDWLFPANSSTYSSGANPVAPNLTVQVPSPEQDYLILDANTGTETFYVAFSAARWPVLEEALSRSGAHASAAPAAGGPATISNRRGVGGTGGDVQNITVTRGKGNAERMTLPTRLYRGTGPCVVVKRWFRHVAP